MKYLIFIFVLVFLLFPMIINAEGEGVARIETLLDYVANVLYVIGIGLAVIIILVSGVMYMTAGGDEEKVKKAKKTLTYGLIGTVILAASGFIMDVLEGILVSAGVI